MNDIKIGKHDIILIVFFQRGYQVTSDNQFILKMNKSFYIEKVSHSG